MSSPGGRPHLPVECAPRLRPGGPFGLLPRPLTIRDVRRENSRTATFVLDGELPEAKPGQFVMVWLPGHEEAPFSLAYHCPVTLTIAAVGPLTRAIHGLGPGEALWLRGPYGRPFGVEPETERPLLVGGGYGVAPLAFLAEHLLAAGRRPAAFVGGRTAEDIIGVARLEDLGVPVVVTTEDGSRGEAGLVTQPVGRFLARGEGDVLYGVGPHGMLYALARLARAHGVPAQLSWEAYMGCAVGLCGMCEHDGALLCVEGPVRHVILE